MIVKIQRLIKLSELQFGAVVLIGYTQSIKEDCSFFEDNKPTAILILIGSDYYQQDPR